MQKGNYVRMDTNGLSTQSEMVRGGIEHLALVLGKSGMINTP